VTYAQSASASTVRLLVLGKRLRDLREAAGKSFEQAARVLDVSPLTVRRMEQGQVRWKIPYLRILLGEYGVGVEEADAFLAMAAEANQPGWWYRYRDVLPSWFRAYVSLEEEAGLIRAYEPHYVPGLLQTEDYARSILRAGLRKSEEEVERTIALRMERQKLLTHRRQPHELWVVIDETVLRRPVVPPEVMRPQIDRLMEAAHLPNIRLQIVPFALCVHEAMYGPFHIFRFPHPELPDIVYVENVLGAVYLEEYNDVSAFQRALDRMCAQALSIQRTEAFLDTIRKEL
jgi:transcriptional regulator with XRE-family HTH domain